MSNTSTDTAAVVNDALQRIATGSTAVGQTVSRYGLVIVLACIGFGKFVKMEARVLIGVALWTLGDSLGARKP